MMNLKLFISRLLKLVWPSVSQNKNVKFICTGCGFKEKIPKCVVDDMDIDDFEGDLCYPPRFSCDYCSAGTMYPLYYKSHRGITYRYNPKTRKFTPELPA